MALNFQKVNINLSGLDEKTDNKQLQLGTFGTLKNMWMDKTRQLKKRYGTTKTHETLPQYNRVCDFNGKPIVWEQSAFAYANIEGTLTRTDEKWIAGSYEVTDWSAQLGVSDYIDYAESDDYGIGARLVQTETTPAIAIELTFYDPDTKRPFYRTTVGNDKFKIVSTDDRVLVFYNLSDTIQLREYQGFDVSGNPAFTQTEIQASDPNLVLGAVDATTSEFNTYAAFICTYSSTAVTSRVRIYVYDYSTSTLSVVDTSIGNPRSYVSINERFSTDFILAYADDSPTYDVIVDILTLPTTLVGATTVATYPGESYEQLCVVKANSRDYLFLKRQNAGAGTSGNVLDVYEENGGWSLFDQLGNCSLASKPFEFITGDGTRLLHFYISKGQAFNDTTNVGIALCWGFENTASGQQIRKGAEFLLPSSGISSFSGFTPPPTVTKKSFVGYTTVFATSGAVNSAKIVSREYNNIPIFDNWQFGVLNNVTPNLRLFDGISNNLVGWAVYPAQPISITSSGAGSAYPAGDYGVRACYVRYDAQGNVSRSAPSITQSANLAASSGVDVELEPYPFFDPQTDVEDVWLEVYRTEVDGGVYYLDGRIKVGDDTYASGSFDKLDYSFQKTETEIISQPLLYTEGGVLEHIGPPAIRSFKVSRERVWALSAEDGRPWFSKARVKGEFPNFSDALILDYEGVTGLTAASPMDDKTILFSEKNIFAVYGLGPDEVGAGSFDVQQLTTDVGTSQPASVVYTSIGIYYMSMKGIYFLDRGLNSSFIGARIEDQREDEIRGSYELEDREQVWFTAFDGSVQIYDEYHKIWYNNEINMNIGYSANVGSVPHFIGAFQSPSETALLKEDKSVYTDNSQNYECKLTTGWMNLADIQGFQRVRKFSFEGDGISDPSNIMQVRYFTDFNDSTPDETFSAVASDILAITNDYSWESKPKKQRMKSLKLDITFTTADSSFSISSLALEAGRHRGIYRQTRTKRVRGA